MSALQSTPLIGLPQLTGWSQVAITPNHQLWVAFAVAGQNAGNVGREVMSWLQAQEPSSTSTVHTLLTQLLGLVRDKACDIQVSLAWQHDSKMVFGAIKGSVLLKRQTKVGTLLQSTGEIQLIEGRFQEDDVVVLLTQQASDYLGEIQQKMAAGFDVDSIITGLVPSVHTQPDSSLTACVFISQAPPAAPALEVAELPISLPAVSSPELEDVLGLHSLDTESLPTQDFPEVASPILPVLEEAVPLTDVPAKQGLSIELELNTAPSGLNTKSRRSFANKVKPDLGRVWRTVGRVLQGMQTLTKSRELQQRLVRVGIVLLILGLVLGGAVWWWQRRLTKGEQTAQAAVQPWLDQLAQAETQLETDPLVARQTAAAAVAELSKVAQDFAKKPGGKKITQAALETAETRSQHISGLSEQQELPVFYDARLLQSDFVASLARSRGGTAWLVDTDKRQAIILDVASKKAEVVDLSKMARITDLAIDGDAVWLLGDGLWKTTAKTPGELIQVKPEGDSNRAGRLISVYNSFVYVINPEKRNIYRYAKVKDNEYTEPIGWLQSSQGISLPDVSSISIDGDVWLGTQQGEIKKLTSGSPVEFGIQGLNQALQGSIWLVTNADSENLYILEPNAGRVVLLRKDGTLLKELTSPVLKSSTGILLEESSSKVLAVSGSLLFELKL